MEERAGPLVRRQLGGPSWIAVVLVVGERHPDRAAVAARGDAADPLHVGEPRLGLGPTDEAHVAIVCSE